MATPDPFAGMGDGGFGGGVGRCHVIIALLQSLKAESGTCWPINPLQP